MSVTEFSRIVSCRREMERGCGALSDDMKMAKDIQYLPLHEEDQTQIGRKLCHWGCFETKR